MSGEMKLSSSVWFTWIPIWGMKWNVVCPSVLCRFQLRVKWIVVCPSVWQNTIWGMKWNVCPSVIRGFQYKGWNESSSSVWRIFQYEGRNETYFVRLSYLYCSVLGKEVCPSVCLDWIQIWVVKWTADFRLSDVDLIMEGEWNVICLSYMDTKYGM